MHSRVSIALLSSSLIAGVASAQSTQAVEWKVSDGGNGHWYAVAVADKTWTHARTTAEASGGYLASFNSSQERVWCFQLTVGTPGAWRSVFSATRALGPWIGGLQLPQSTEPSGGWIWTDGSPVDLVAAGCDLNNATACGVNEDRLSFWGDGFPMSGSTKYIVSDFPERGYCESAVGPTPSYIIEWSADCNSDGIVDYGQIQSGQLQDDNQNNVPDVCESTVTGVIPVSGASSGGTSVIINGTNFPQNPTVLIGGSVATNVVRVSANRITAVTPAGLPGMTSVTVGNWVQPNAFYYRPECGSDLDQDGEVTAADIAIVLLDFGPCYATATSTQPEDSTPFMLREQADSAAPLAP
jgi:hypothetical protein